MFCEMKACVSLCLLVSLQLRKSSLPTIHNSNLSFTSKPKYQLEEQEKVSLEVRLKTFVPLCEGRFEEYLTLIQSYAHLIYIIACVLEKEMKCQSHYLPHLPMQILFEVRSPLDSKTSNQDRKLTRNETLQSGHPRGKNNPLLKSLKLLYFQLYLVRTTMQRNFLLI